jgi:quinolinate synthase
MNTLPKLLDCLRNETPEITLQPSTIDKAKLPIEKMLQWS